MKKNKITKELTKKLNSLIASYVYIFKNKHEIEFEFWVADQPGTIACFSNEYYVDFETIRLDLESDAPLGVFFEWYDMTLELGLENKSTINYYTYLKLKKSKNK